MALTPLSFSIGVKDEASSQLEKINAELNNLVSKLDSIKNIAISLGGDPKEAESLMQSLNGVASSLANISKLSPEAQAASDRLTTSQQKLNEATEMYNGLLAKIKASNPTQAFQDITKGLTGLSANGFAGGFKKLDPTEWAGFFRKFLVQSSDLSAKDVEGNVNQIVANIRRALSESLSNGKPFASILEEGFNFDSVNQRLNEAFAKLRDAYIKGMQELKEFETNKNGFNAVGSVIPGLQQQVEAAKKELETLKNAASTTPVNPESFKGAEGAVTELNATIKTLGEALNKLDFSKINGGLDQLAEKLNKLITELDGVEGRMKTAFTGALEANVKSLGDVIDGLAKKMAGMSAPVTEGMKQGEQATNGQTDAAKSLSQVLQDLSQKYKHTAEQAQRLAELASGDKLTKAGVQRELRVGYKQATDIVDTINALNKLTQTEQQQTQSTKDLGQSSQQAAEQVQKLAQSAVTEAFSQLAASLTKIKELFDNLAKADGLTQLNNTINGVNTTVEALAKTLSNVSNAVKFTGSTEEIAAYEAKVKSLQEQIAALEAKAKGLGETAKVAAEQVQAVSGGGKGGSSKEGLSDAQLKRVNDQLDLLKKRLDTINEPYTQAKELGFKDETIAAKIKYLQDYRAALDEAVKAGSLSGIKVGDYSIFSRAANEEIPSQSQANKMAKQLQEYIAIQQQAQAEAERQAQAQERMRQAAEAAGMSLVKAGEQTQSAGQKTEGAKQQMHGFTEEILVNMRSWEQAGKMMAVLEKRIFEIMAQLQSGNLLKFDTGNLQSDIQELMRFYNIMKEIRNNFGYAQIGDAMLTTSKVLKESGLDFGQTWEKNKQELTAVKTIYEQMMRLQSLANNKNALPTDSLNTKYQRDALQNALRAEEIMAKLKSVDLRQATALVGGQDYQQATAGIEAFFKAYNQNANIAKSQTAELQRLLEKIQGTDKGGGWINVMRSAGVSEDKIKEMRQIAEKIQRAIAALEQSRQMGTAANFVQSDWYRATVIEGKKANDTGYLAVREAHEQAAAEREAAKAIQESAKAAEKKREEMSKAWREQEAARQKETAAVEASMQKQMAAEEKARQKSIEDAWKAADQFAKAKQEEAATAAKTAAAKTKEEVKGYDEQIGKLYELERAMSKRFASEQEAQRQYNALLEQTKALKDRILAAENKAKTVGADTSVLSGAWMKAYNFQEKLQGISEKDQKTAYRVGALEEEYKKLAQALTQAAKEQEKLNAAAEKEKKRKADDKLKEYQREETGIRRVIAATDEATRLMSRLESTGMRGLSLGLDVSKIDDARNKLQEFINRLDAFDKYADTHATTELIGNFNILRRSLVETAKAQEQLNSAQERANKKAETKAEQQAAKDAREARQEQEKWAESMRRAGVEITNLDVLLRKLSATERAGASLGIDTSRLRDQISLIQRYLRILEGVASGGNRDWNAGAIMKGGDRIAGELGLPNAIKLANEAASAVNKETKEIQKNQAEKQKAASSTNQLTAEEQRLAQALNQTTEHARGQSQVLSDLKMMATQYLGVWGAQQFLHNIIEIGGQLEMQRMSIGAILQNQSQANDLFEKIKGLAVQSPFGVVELDQMTKQLTAYGFKYSELFDMTKRLADISAATGTGVDRLALALGHVRSEAALSGYTLRQFSMGNVPLLAKLSEKLGKTTQEIRKMVRAKEISYEDVEGVIKDLTNEGGMFYNMQEVISQSVKARFKNVKDAMAIMYGEMAESGIGDVLKSVADALMEITQNWKDVATVMGTGVAVWAAHRVAVMAYTTTLGKTNAAVLASIASHNKQEASILSLASKYRVLTVTEQERLAAARKNIVVDKLRLLLGKTTKAELASRDAATKRLFLSDIQLAMSEKKLTIEELARLVALGKVTKAEALQIITNLQLADSEKMVAANTIMGTKRLGTFKMGLLAVGGAAKTAALALKSLIFNPAMLGMAAITALIELWQRNNAEMERAKELGNAIFEASQEGLKNTRTMMENTGINAYQADTNSKGEMVLRNLTKSFGTEQESSRTFLVKPEFDSATAQQIIDEWSQYIRDYAGTPNRILNQALLDEAGNVRTLEEQFNHLFNSVQNVANAQKAIVDIADAIQSAQEETGSGWLNEDLVEDFADYDSALKKYNKSIVMAYHEHSRAVKKGIDAARKADSTFAKNTEGMASYSEMLKELVENSKLYSSQAGKAFNEAAEENSGIISRLFANKSDLHLGAEVEAEKEFKVFKDNLKIILEGLGQDVENLTPEMKQGLMSMFINKVLGQDKLGRMSKEAKDKFIKDFADFIGETIDDAEEITKKRLADWQKRAGEVFIVNQNIKVKTKTITSLHEFAEEVQKDLKEKQEYITKEASHIKQTLTIQTGIKFNMQKIDASELDRIIIQLSEKVKKLAREGHVDTAKSLLSVVQDELMPFRDVLKSIDENKKWLKQEGYPEKDPTKDKSKNKHDSKKSYKDPVAEEWKERIRLLKDANSLYKEWNKREGEDEALNRVRTQYGDIFEKWRTDKNVPWKDFKAEDIIEYRNYIQKIVDEAQKRYDAQRNDKAKNYGKEAEAVLREGKKLLDDIDRYDFDEKAKDFTAAATKSIEQLNKRWEIFKSTVDTTGDALLAAQLAGFGDAERGARTAAEAMRNELVKQLNQLGGSDLVAKIPLDIDLNEEEVRDIFLNAIPNADAVEDYKESINALIKLYQEWQKLQQKTNSDDIGIYTKIIGLASSYDAQLRKINKDLQEQLASISANPLLSSGQKAGAGLMAKASADWKKMKLSADYANLHNRAVAMSAEEYEKAEKKIKDLIERLRLLGMMSPEEEISETKALDKAASERRQDTSGAFGHFITGGAQGLRDYYQRLADAALRSRSMYAPGSAEWKKADDEYNKNKKKAEAIDDEIAGIQATQAALENLQKAASVLSDFFTAIAGESGEGAALGSISGGAMSGASALSGFGPWGMAAGAILGGATAMIQEGDKAAERAIQELRGDVQAIESNTEEILRLRERTLGYDSGKYLADLYKNQAALVSEYFANPFDSKEAEKSFHASWGASIMSDWYKELYGGASSGYEAQYNNLIEQRKNYLAILDEQNEKKHKSDEEIAETKSKIAELDDQIMNFSQDLAKELWGIDIKGWADQLSDALASAFENGENMAKAYRDTVTSIIQQMMQKMMQIAILEPMFERLQKQLFGENGKGGVFDPNNPKGSMSKVTKIIGDYFGKGGEGEKAITASMEFMTAFQRGMQNAGLTVLNEASNTLSSGIQGTSEETSDLLAGYVNALRQDVSVNRILLTQYVTQLWPQYIEAYTAQVTSVSNIDNNVRVIMEMMQLGNGAMYEQIAAMRTRIDNIVLGIDRVSVR